MTNSEKRKWKTCPGRRSTIYFVQPHATPSSGAMSHQSRRRAVLLLQHFHGDEKMTRVATLAARAILPGIASTKIEPNTPPSKKHRNPEEPISQVRINEDPNGYHPVGEQQCCAIAG